MKDQQSSISVFVACLTIQVATRGTSPDVTTVFHTWAYGRFIEIQSNLRRRKSYFFEKETILLCHGWLPIKFFEKEAYLGKAYLHTYILNYFEKEAYLLLCHGWLPIKILIGPNTTTQPVYFYDKAACFL